MTEYTITFRTAAECAVHDIEAATPEHALQLAQELWEASRHTLYFESYDSVMSLESIAVEGGDAPALEWTTPETTLALAADDLLEALELAVAALNEAPRFPVPSHLTDSYRIASTCDRAIAKAKGGAA